MSDTSHDAGHSGPIRNPKQLLIAVFFSFFVPVFAIIGLVWFVVTSAKPSGTKDKVAIDLGSVVAADSDRVLAQRIAKVGTSHMRDPNRVLKSGEEVFKAQCTTCHTPGVGGAPKVGDVAAWAPRLRTGWDALLNSALHGKGAMPPQGGGDLEDTEVARGVAYLANSAGGKFAEPQMPKPAVAVAAAPASAPVIVPSPDVVAALAAINRGAAAPVVTVAAAPAAAGNTEGQALYQQVCQTCHATGVANAPKLGDKAAWAPRIAQGVDALHANVLKGKGAMPPKGGATAPDAAVIAASDYMINASK